MNKMLNKTLSVEYRRLVVGLLLFRWSGRLSRAGLARMSWRWYEVGVGLVDWTWCGLGGVGLVV